MSSESDGSNESVIFIDDKQQTEGDDDKLDDNLEDEDYQCSFNMVGNQEGEGFIVENLKGKMIMYSTSSHKAN